jgi:hypothetical protein
MAGRQESITPVRAPAAATGSNTARRVLPSVAVHIATADLPASPVHLQAAGDFSAATDIRPAVTVEGVLELPGPRATATIPGEAAAAHTSAAAEATRGVGAADRTLAEVVAVTSAAVEDRISGAAATPVAGVVLVAEGTPAVEVGTAAAVIIAKQVSQFAKKERQVSSLPLSF